MRPFPPPGSTVIIYARYSTKNQDYRSIEGQVSLCRDYAAKHGWVVVGVYFDEARSGTSLVGRTGFFEAMAAADRGEGQVFLVEDVDRASRDPADTHTLAKTLDELDIAFCTVSGGVASDLEVGIKAIQNAQYVKQNTEKTKRGQQHAVASGRVSGSITYGHRKVHKLDDRGRPINGLREIEPPHAAIVQRIFRDYDAGVSTIDICRSLNAEGVPSPHGKVWGPGALTGNGAAALGLLRNRFYIGEFHWRRTKRRRRQGKVQVRPTLASERMVNHHPELAIIDTDLFERVQARLGRGGPRPFHTFRKPDYLFTGLLTCGYCGSAYIVMNKRLGCVGRAKTGACTNSRRVERQDVEETILERLKAHLLGPELLEPCLSEYRTEAQRAAVEYAGRAELGQARLKEIEQRIANLVGQLGDANGTSFAGRVMMQEIDRLEGERQRLEREAKQKPPALAPVLDAHSVAGRIGATLEQLRTALESDDREAARAREVLRSLIAGIVISPIPGSEVDGRGAGPVMITVHGRLAELLGLADITVDRAIQHGYRTEASLDGRTLGFRFSYLLFRHDPRTRQTFADLPVLSRVLDRALVPAPRRAFLEALAEADVVVEGAEVRSLEERLRYALEHLSSKGYARAISAGSRSGWVWAHIPLSDQAWKARALHPHPETLPPLMRRAEPPEAMVVVIGASANL